MTLEGFEFLKTCQSIFQFTENKVSAAKDLRRITRHDVENGIYFEPPKFKMNLHFSVDSLKEEIMRTKANISGHPVHPMIVAFPITFYTVTLIAFAVYNWVNSDPFWFRLGYFCNLAGVGTAVLAAIPGLVDWALAIPNGTEAKARGLLHMSLNVFALLLFAVSAYLLRGSWDAPPEMVRSPFWLSLIGVGVTMVAGYHGWEMIATHKMGVNLTDEEEQIEMAREARPRETGGPLRPHRV